MEMVFSVPVVWQAMMILMMSLFSRNSVCFSVCLRMRLRTPKIIKIFWGSIPPDPPTVNNCRVAMFSTSANDTAPPDEKVMYSPEKYLLAIAKYIMVIPTCPHCVQGKHLMRN